MIDFNDKSKFRKLSEADIDNEIPRDSDLGCLLRWNAFIDKVETLSHYGLVGIPISNADNAVSTEEIKDAKEASKQIWGRTIFKEGLVTWEEFWSEMP